MKLLLDTYILLWYLDNNPKLPGNWKLCIEDRHNSITVSMVSLWEITIKVSLGKLELQDDLTAVENILRQQGITFLPIRTAHLLRLSNLPFHHRDLFDRLIIAQAQAEQLTLVSDDGMFAAYSVSLLD
jgi:PIN domain nuclease of toxin-antitoxin system